MDASITQTDIQTKYRASSYAICKRVLDILISASLLLLLSPLLLSVALLVKLSSPGPILFQQERMGHDKERFQFLKFRSMRPMAAVERATERHNTQKEKGKLYKDKHDPRITGIGRIIRKSSIDELPQLINVLKGEMSIVGPRPLIPFMLDDYPDFHDIRAKVRPGITGLWQIRDREHNTSAAYMVEHDTEYIENMSLRLDLSIMLRTFQVVISAKGAY